MINAANMVPVDRQYREDTPMMKQEPHATEETLEAYALGRLAGPELDSFEDHLLVCETCQGHLAETETYIRTMRAAVEQIEREDAGKKPPMARRISKPVWAAALAVAAMFALFWNLPQPATKAQAVQLHSIRGNESPAAHGKGGQPLVLNIDVTELPAASAYRLEVVDARGALEWSGDVTASSNRISAAVVKTLPAGRYWVRLYSGGELRREFSLLLD
jgi:hypothetical protein